MHSNTTVITPAVDDGIDRTPTATPKRIRPRKLDRLATRTAVNAPRGLSARQWRESGKLLGPSRGAALKPARAGDPVPFFRGPALSEAIAKAAKYADKPRGGKVLHRVCSCGWSGDSRVPNPQCVSHREGVAA